MRGESKTGIELKAEFAQIRQRETGNLRHHHHLCPILRHPDRQLRQRAIGLTDDQSDVVTMAIAPGNNNRFAVTGMKSVTDNRLTRLIAGIMELLRRHSAPSSACGTLRLHERW